MAACCGPPCGGADNPHINCAKHYRLAGGSGGAKLVRESRAPSYKRNDPRGWGGDPKRGAALGRPSDHAPGFSGKIFLKRVRLDRGGYDPNGTYFGTGEPLFWAATEDGEVDYMLRARDRADARAKVLAKYPGAKVRQ